MPTVTFAAEKLTVTVADGASIFDAAGQAGIAIPTACVAKGTCGLCRVKILAGEAFLSPFSLAESQHLGNVYFLNKVRLSCQARITVGDVTVEVRR